MANVLVTIGKDITVGAEDLLKWVTNGNSAAQSATPGALAALGTLATGVEKALGDADGAAQNPLAALINAPAELSDFKAVWPDLKAFLAKLGITV